MSADQIKIADVARVADSAELRDKIHEFNYKATKEAIARAMKGEPKIDEILAKKDSAKHPFSPK